MKKVNVVRVGGCVERWLDANRICDYLVKNDYKIVEKPDESDIILLVTCAVFNDVVEYTFKTIEKYQKYNAKLVIGGCLPDIEKERLAKIFDGETLPTKEIDKKIEDVFPPQKNVKYSKIDDSNIPLQYEIVQKEIERKEKKSMIKDYLITKIFGNKSISYKYFTEKGSLYHIRVSWGCIGNCSFCATKKAVGPHISKPLDVCIKEFKDGLKQGYKDFIICSDDPGAYGIDINTSFTNLLDEMTKIPGDYKIMITGFSPGMIVKHTDKLIDVLKRGKITAILSPVQSGSDKVLKLMNRYSDSEKVKESILKLKKAFPDLIIESQFIVGFPGESWKNFEDTLKFIVECNFYSGHIYKFSCRSGTEAENIEPKITEEEISKRIKYTKKYLKKAGYKMSHFTLGITKGMYIFHLD